MVDRPSWQEHWFTEAINAAKMSTCKSRRVGAVFVRDNKQLTTGFNGVPSNYPHPKTCKRIDQKVPSGEKLELCKCAHAEANAIATAAEMGISLKDSVLYCTTFPCWICMGLLANIGIKEVNYLGLYGTENKDVDSTDIASHKGIKLYRLDIDSIPGIQKLYNKVITSTPRFNDKRIPYFVNIEDYLKGGKDNEKS